MTLDLPVNDALCRGASFLFSLLGFVLLDLQDGWACLAGSQRESDGGLSPHTDCCSVIHWRERELGFHAPVCSCDTSRCPALEKKNKLQVGDDSLPPVLSAGFFAEQNLWFSPRRWQKKWLFCVFFFVVQAFCNKRQDETQWTVQTVTTAPAGELCFLFNRDGEC